MKLSKKMSFFVFYCFSIFLIINLFFSANIKANALPEKITKTDRNFLPHQHNWDPFYKFIGKTIKYPKEAQETNISGPSQVTFKIIDGKVTNLAVVKRLGHGCDEEFMKAILSYPNFDKSFDGKYAFVASFALQGKGRIVTKEEAKPIDGFTNLNQVVIIAYEHEQKTADKSEKLINSEVKGKTSNLDINKDQAVDFTKVDKMPEFPGGLQMFYKYLGNTILYPTSASIAGIQGKVFIQFTVEKDGSLTDFKILRGVSDDIDAEAIRVLKESPKWNPGVQNGKLVRVRYNIAVNFSLQPDKNAPLVFVDGKEFFGNMMNIPAKDIESISVLKAPDQIASYGEKGKNGVILIKLKKKVEENK